MLRKTTGRAEAMVGSKGPRDAFEWILRRTRIIEGLWSFGKTEGSDVFLCGFALWNPVFSVVASVLARQIKPASQKKNGPKSQNSGPLLNQHYLGSSAFPVMLNFPVCTDFASCGCAPPSETVYSPGTITRFPSLSTCPNDRGSRVRLTCCDSPGPR